MTAVDPELLEQAVGWTRAAGELTLGWFNHAELTIDALTDWLDGRLAHFKRPKDLVVYEELPRNAGGKVVKGQLRDQDAQGSDRG